MEQRVNPAELAPEGLGAVMALENHVRGAIDHDLLELVKLRASVLNDCAYCVDMHGTDALAAGEEPRRVLAVAAWPESPFFTDEERAALALTDAVTRLDGGVDDTTWSGAVAAFGEAGTVELLLAIATINVWNRIAVPVHMAPPELAS